MEFEPTGVHRAQGHYVSDSMSSGMVNILRRDGLELQTISDFRPINHTKSRNLGTQFNSTLTNAADEQRSIVSDFPPFFDPYNIPSIIRASHLEALPTRTMTDGHGDRFTGYVFNDHMVFGTRTNRERGVYTGWFDADGKASGCGRTVFPDSTTESGLYLADRFIGGEVNHSDGIRLIGRQVNFSLHGDNCLVIGSNWFRHGSFRHNRLNGNGSFVSTKLIEMGVLRDGELVSGELWMRQSGVIRVGDFDANGLVSGYEINHDDRGFVRTTVDGNQRVSDSPTEFPYPFQSLRYSANRYRFSTPPSSGSHRRRR